MVTAKDVKNMLSDQDIFSLLTDFGADPIMNNVIVARTCCHNSAHQGKHKLVYYSDSKTFRCFTECSSSMDVFGLVSKVMDLEFSEAFKYVCMKFGISHQMVAHEEGQLDTSFFKKFKKQKETIELNILDKSILNTYHDLYHHLWIEDGISIPTMKKFGIKFSILDNQIIIPHHDIDDNLIGVRARNLNEEVVARGQKYMPVYYKKNVLKHPTGAALYGLNLTKEQVEKNKAVILFESEKSVLQLDSMCPDMSIGACISGSSLTNNQLEILKQLDIDEVIVALDKEFTEIGSQEEKFYKEKINNVFLNKLIPFFRCSVIWDMEGLLDLKDSPTDKGYEVFKKLFESRIRI